MEEIDVIVSSWWSFLLKGLAALALGIALIAYPGATAKAFFLIFGIFLLIFGAIDLIRGIYHLFKKERWFVTFAWGIFDLLIAGIVLGHLNEASLTVIWILSIIVGIWVLVMGILELVGAFELPPIKSRPWLAGLGAISIIFGIVILAMPFDTVYALMVILGIYAIIAGLVDIVMSVYLPLETRKLKKELK